jgi:hypothetical protein
MIIFVVVVVVVVVVLFACVTMQRKKELMCELKKKIRVSICLSLHFSITRDILILPRVTLHLRIAKRVGEDSCCRGGIVRSRFGFSRALLVRPESSTALWRFRVSTSNSPSGRSRPPTYTHIRHIYHTFAQQDIRVCEDDHFEPPKWQYTNPTALPLLRVSI